MAGINFRKWQFKLPTFCNGVIAIMVCSIIMLVPGHVRAQSKEWNKLYALLIIDTNTNLKTSVEIDRNRMDDLLRTGISGDRLVKEVLQGDDVTPEKVLSTIQNWPSTPNDALFVYFAGHGATDPTLFGQYMAFQADPTKGVLDKNLILHRVALRDALLKKNAGLTVIVTDCCSNVIELSRLKAVPGSREESNPVLKHLFFKQRGLVDITASTNTPSYGDNSEGGIFTRTMGKLALKHVSELDLNKDQFVSWQEFGTHLKKDTSTTYKQWLEVKNDKGETNRSSLAKRSARGEEGIDPDQVPREYHLLPDRILGDVTGENSFAVITVVNEYPAEKEGVGRIRYRWSESSEWVEDSIQPGKWKVIRCPLNSPDSPLPQLEMQEIIEGQETPAIKLDARLFKGKKSPGANEGARYKIRDPAN